MEKFKIGEEVIYNKNDGEDYDCYPPKGTKGIITEVGDCDLRVLWEKGRTRGKGNWYCNKNDVIKSESEILKMKKYKLLTNGGYIDCDDCVGKIVNGRIEGSGNLVYVPIK